MLFCPNCNNILDISKNPPKNNQQSYSQNLSTPNTISNTDTDTNNEDQIPDMIDDVIDKLLQEVIISDSILSEIKMEQLIKSKKYQKLDKKQKSQVQSKLISLIEKIDDSINTYYFCKNCMYSKLIDPGSLIISRIGIGSVTEYINLDRLKNRVYSKILPITRNYICINEKCDTNRKDDKRKSKEAVFYRIGNNMQIWYSCKICESYWQQLHD